MTKDLEVTLNGLGPEYRVVVERLVAGAEVQPRLGRSALYFQSRRRFFKRVPFLVAASLLILLGFKAAIFRKGDAPVVAASSWAAHEYRLAELPGSSAIDEMIRTQNADGSWRNDFLTRRNAEALARCSESEAKVAYKKAMRNLRIRGLL